MVLNKNHYASKLDNAIVTDYSQYLVTRNSTCNTRIVKYKSMQNHNSPIFVDNRESMIIL